MPSTINKDFNKMDASTNQEQNEELIEIDYEELKKQREKSDLISKKLGELLLKGFKMLDQTCNTCGCILMKYKDEPVLCVYCQDINKTIKTEPLTPTQKSEQQPQPQAQQQQQQQQQNEFREKYSSNLDIVSNKLGDLLLKGYRMLNSHCDICDCVLMQRKTDEPICVNCDEFEEKPTKIKQQKLDMNLKTTTTATTIKAEPEVRAQNNGTTKSSTVEETLKVKIEWANRELLRSVNDIKREIDLCELIRSATNALLSLNQLKNADI